MAQTILKNLELITDAKMEPTTKYLIVNISLKVALSAAELLVYVE